MLLARVESEKRDQQLLSYCLSETACGRDMRDLGQKKGVMVTRGRAQGMIFSELLEQTEFLKTQKIEEKNRGGDEEMKIKGQRKI